MASLDFFSMAPSVRPLWEGQSFTSGLILYMSQLLNISNYNTTCEMEDENLFNPYAVAITEKGSNVIGHNIPRKISAASVPPIPGLTLKLSIPIFSFLSPDFIPQSVATYTLFHHV